MENGWKEGGSIIVIPGSRWFASLLTRRSVTARGRPRIRPLLGRVPLQQCLLAGMRQRRRRSTYHLPLLPPTEAYIYPAYHGPVICHWITLIKRFSPSVGCRARSFIDASAIPWISLRSTREGRRGGVGWGKPEIAIRTDTSYWQLSSRWPVCCAGLCYNRGWEQSALEICRTWGGKGGGGERNDPRLIRGKLFEFSDWWITISMV